MKKIKNTTEEKLKKGQDAWIRENLIEVGGVIYKKACVIGGKYPSVRIPGKTVRASKLVWAIHNDGAVPDAHVWHKDGNAENNIISNLDIGTKPISRSLMAEYKKRIAEGKDYPGVTWHKSHEKWMAWWRGPNKDTIYLGHYATEKEAADAVKKYCEENCPQENPYA